MTLKELKSKCREKGLKVSGTKKDLMERLNSPSPQDLSSSNETTVRVYLKWGDSRSKAVSHLVEKKFAKFVCYATDHFVYDIKKENWTEILNNS